MRYDKWLEGRIQVDSLNQVHPLFAQTIKPDESWTAQEGSADSSKSN